MSPSCVVHVAGHGKGLSCALNRECNDDDCKTPDNAVPDSVGACLVTARAAIRCHSTRHAA
jgi:hypothetical protein